MKSGAGCVKITVMDTEKTTDKLKQVTIGKPAKAQVVPSAADREEQINYLRALFWLSFRVYDGDLKLPDDNVVDLHDGETAGFGGIDESDLAGFRRDFEELGALDVFYKLCLDYCKDQLAVLKKRSAQIWGILEKYAKNDPQMVAKIKPKSRARYDKLYEFYKQRADMNYYEQRDLKAQMAEIKKQMAALKQGTPVVSREK